MTKGQMRVSILARAWGAAAGLLVLFLLGSKAFAAAPAKADVVVVVDTSTSMKQPGMDPERTSLLVAKLLADIVPGDLAAVRLLDMGVDKAWLPAKPTGKMVPCEEDPTKTCELTNPVGDWEKESRENRYGALARPARGDPAFKKQLESHLEQRANNSLFHLAFRSAQGVFDQRPRSDARRTLVWLSDGRSEHHDPLKRVVEELRREKTEILAVVFGKGEVALATKMGLDVQRTTSPAELMKAFAGIFRRIVEAPYEWDRTLAAEPAFEMKAGVDETWVVVYGDATLGDVVLEGPAGEKVTANHGADAWPTAGAYRVAYMQRPNPGRWQVRAVGGGAGAAYAVVQRSSLTPILIQPKTAVAGVSTRIVAAVGSDGAPVPTKDIPGGVEMEVSIDGGPAIRLTDDGTGMFTADVVFPKSGSIQVRLHARGPIVDRTTDVPVHVTGQFRYRGGPIHVDFGTLRAGAQVCRPLDIVAEQQGEIPFGLELLRGSPPEHALWVETARGHLTAGAKVPIFRAPNENASVCLSAGESAPSSESIDEPTLRLGVSGSSDPEHGVVLHLTWRVLGLTFWQLWGWLILTILGVLFVLFVILGYVLPKRFAEALAVAFAPGYEEVAEQAPQPVKQWKGVGIGFYKNARAYLHPSFRLSGKAHGALASLEAIDGGTLVLPGRDHVLYRETSDGEWVAIATTGRRGTAGDVFRVGDKGPYFRVSVRR